MDKIIYYFNWDKDWPLIKKNLGQKEYGLIKLEIDENLHHNLCEMIKDQFTRMNHLTPVPTPPKELYEGYYQTAIYSLVRKWQVEQAGLLDVWAELGTRLARSQYFTNGNKRTALLSMIAFIQACGFQIKEESNNHLMIMKWEKLMIDLATVESEELAIELAKERIILELKY